MWSLIKDQFYEQVKRVYGGKYCRIRIDNYYCRMIDDSSYDSWINILFVDSVATLLKYEKYGFARNKRKLDQFAILYNIIRTRTKTRHNRIW